MSNDFKLTAELVIELLERAEFRTARVHGRHRIMLNPDGRATTIPVESSRKIAQGTLNAVLRDAGLIRNPPIFPRLLATISRLRRS